MAIWKESIRLFKSHFKKSFGPIFDGGHAVYCYTTFPALILNKNPYFEIPSGKFTIIKTVFEFRSVMNQESTLDFVYRDDAIVVVDKPGGLASVPGRGPDRQDCVESRLRAIYPGCIAQPAVHRLDMPTSGLMVLGLTAEAHRTLSMAFESRSITKRYVAVLEGEVEASAGDIELCLPAGSR